MTFRQNICFHLQRYKILFIRKSFFHFFTTKKNAHIKGRDDSASRSPTSRAAFSGYTSHAAEVQQKFKPPKKINKNFFLGYLGKYSYLCSEIKTSLV